VSREHDFSFGSRASAGRNRIARVRRRRRSDVDPASAAVCAADAVGGGREVPLRLSLAPMVGGPHAADAAVSDGVESAAGKGSGPVGQTAGRSNGFRLMWGELGLPPAVLVGHNFRGRSLGRISPVLRTCMETARAKRLWQVTTGETTARKGIWFDCRHPGLVKMYRTCFGWLYF